MSSNNFTQGYPHLLDEWDYSRNPISPEETTMGGKEKYWWKCANGHSWESTILHRAYHKSSCKTCFNIDKTETYTIKDIIIKGTKEKFTATCDKGHFYETSIASLKRTNADCPYCSSRKVLKGFNDILTLNPDLAKEIQNDIDLSNTLNSSSMKVSWKCPKYDSHIWETKIRNRTIRGDGCIYCNNKKVLVGFNDLNTVFPELVQEWDYNNNAVSPEECTYGSEYKAAWICEAGHSWETKILKRTTGDKTGCPKCAKYGFDDSKPSELYFIYNEDLKSYKIGITNSGGRRIRKFEKLGWQIIKVISHDNGIVIRDLETLMFRWIRKELRLNPSVSKKDMSLMAGWSETFGSEWIEEKEVLDKIDVTYSSLKDRIR